jgi:D-psicose/D-tagatose/L-ribulose 3-epimerase
VNNKIGIQYVFWAKDRSVDFVSYVSKVAKLGFDVFGVTVSPLMNLSAEQRKAITTAAADAGIEINFQVGLPKNGDISSADATIKNKGIEFLKESIQITHDMGGNTLSGVLYAAWCVMAENPDKDRRYYLDNSVKSMKEVIKFAEDLGMQLNLEVLNRFEQFLLNTGEQGLEYIQMVGSPNLKLQLDTFHMNIEEDHIGQAILNVGAKLGSLHVCENNRKLPGQGHIPWKEVAQAIRQINYQGYIVIESFALPNCECAKLFSIWRSLEDRDMDLAAEESLKFLRSTFNE